MCIRTSVRGRVSVADSERCDAIAFPIIGAGAGGFDEARAEQVMRVAFAELHADIRVVLVRLRAS